MTTIVKIVGAGVEMPIEEELVDLGNGYATLRRALSAVAPGMPKAKIVEKKNGDDRILEVTPKLDGKGYDPNKHLQECPERRNPAIDMFLSLNTKKLDLGSHEMYNLGVQATAALQEGQDWIKQIEAAEEILFSCSPAACSIVLPG